ncbi:MAG: sulfotransferase domain-containing protein [Trebonia sp.]
MTDNITTAMDPVDLCESNVQRLGKRDIVVAGDPGCGAALISNIVFELGFDYLDPYTEVLDDDGRVQVDQNRLEYYRQRLPATADPASTSEYPRPPASCRFVKTHLYPHLFDGVPLGGAVLLVRDPRDAIYSSYKWFCGFSGSWWPGVLESSEKATFAEFLERRRRGDGETPVSGWARFNESWLEKALSFPRFAVVRFEDLKASPVGTITAMLAALGLEATLDVVTRAAERSSFEAMRAREDEVSAAEGESQTSEARIMRRGKIGEWREWIDSESLADRFADSRLCATAARFGYDLAPGV